LIGCGKENIRFFKMKNNFLPSQLVALNNTSRGKIFNNSVVTSRVVEQSGNRAGGKKPVNVYISTECGHVYIINFFSRQVDKIVQVNDGAIVSLLHFAGAAEANGGFFLTCSRDQGVLRLWNHDFSKLASEVALNQAVASCDINVDGNEIAVLGQNGNISLLELESSAFSVLMRSHADEVLGIAVNDITGTLLSIGKDSSIKVWHAETME
jgi:WD40 repeat protein